MPRPNAKPDPALTTALYEARSLKSERRYNEAIQRYKAILADNLECAEAIGALGHIIGIMGKLDKGESLLREAIAIDPGSAELHHFMAQLSALRIRPDVALAHAAPALELEPKRVESLTLAAQSHERMNRHDEARAFAERALNAKRTDPAANLMMATLDAKAKDFDAAKARLNKLIGRKSTPVDVHHRALTELGFAHDRTSEYEAAYDAFASAGAEIAETVEGKRASKTLVYDRIGAYRGRVTPELVGRFAGETFDTPAPAFLVGFPRSGTTMTEQVLAAHPAIATSDEHPLLDPMGRRLMEGAKVRLDVPGQLERLDRAGVEELRRIYWEGVADRLEGDVSGKLLIDKLPLNIIDLPMINTVFPDAKAIIALRDPRDCCLSCFQQYFVPNPAMIQMLTLEGTVRFYEAVMGLYLEFRDALTMPVLQVRYEDTVRDLEPQARRLIDHLNLDWSDELLSFHEKARHRAIRTPSYQAVTSKVNTKAIGRWRNYQDRFEPLAEKLNPFVSAFGYGPHTKCSV